MSIQWAVGLCHSWFFILFIFLPTTDCSEQINYGVSKCFAGLAEMTHLAHVHITQPCIQAKEKKIFLNSQYSAY